MHKFILKFFDFLKSTVQFIKILIILSIILLLFYWIQNLLGTTWGWMSFSFPFLGYLVGLGELVSKDSFNFFGAIFEYKYAIALLIQIVVYFALNFLMPIIDALKVHYNNLHIDVKNIRERSYNKKLDSVQEKEQKRITKYKIFISAELKKKFLHEGLKYKLDEELIKMNKYLIEKTGIQPEEFESGYLYSFSNFNGIDEVLRIFFKLIKTVNILDFIVCVQVFDGDNAQNFKQLKKLISLKFENKIATMSDTVYRYKFKEFHGFGTSQLGIFQSEWGTIETHEFIEI